MSTAISQESYKRAMREEPSVGVSNGARPEPSLDEARAELAQAISRVTNNLFKDKYGPFFGAISEPAINEFLKGLEANVSRAKEDITLVAEELLNRVIPPRSKRLR